MSESTARTPSAEPDPQARRSTAVPAVPAEGPPQGQEAPKAAVNTHGLERTSPKGQPFIGRCIYCGAEGLRPSAALQSCDRAPSQDQQILDAVRGPEAASSPLLDPQGQAELRGYRCPGCARAFYVEGADNADRCPVCGDTLIWQMAGPFAMPKAASSGRIGHPLRVKVLVREMRDAAAALMAENVGISRAHGICLARWADEVVSLMSGDGRIGHPIIEEAERLRNALRKYLQHKPNCGYWYSPGGGVLHYDCTCGLLDLLKADDRSWRRYVQHAPACPRSRCTVPLAGTEPERLCTCGLDDRLKADGRIGPQEQKDYARMDTMGDSTDSRTASANEAVRTRHGGNHGIPFYAQPRVPGDL